MGRDAYLAATKGGYERPSRPGSGGGGGSQQNKQTGNNSQSGQSDGRSAHLQKSAQKSAEKYRTGIAEMATDEYGRLRNIYTESGFDKEGKFKSGDPLFKFEDGKIVREGGFKRNKYGDQYYTPGFEGVGDKGALLSDLERMKFAALKMRHLTDLGDPVSGKVYEGHVDPLDLLISGVDKWGNPQYTGLGKMVDDNWSNLVTAYDNPAGYGSGYGQGAMLQGMIKQAGADASSRSGGPGGGGGWGGYGGYGGGGSGGGYDMGLPGYGGPVYQRGQVAPGSLQENVNQLYYGMSQGAQPKFSRGGIVSLLRLN